MRPQFPDYWYGYKSAYVAAGMQPPGPDMYAAGGTATGGIAGAALGAALGNMVASQTKEHIFNIPIPGTQAIEDSHGRLLGGALGALAGAYTGHQMGQGYTDQQRARQQWMQRMQEPLYG